MNLGNNSCREKIKIGAIRSYKITFTCKPSTIGQNMLLKGRPVANTQMLSGKRKHGSHAMGLETKIQRGKAGN